MGFSVLTEQEINIYKSQKMKDGTFFGWSLTLIPHSLPLNRAEMLATQATELLKPQ